MNDRFRQKLHFIPKKQVKAKSILTCHVISKCPKFLKENILPPEPQMHNK